jgi:tRNA-dihydrouridine synthase A
MMDRTDRHCRYLLRLLSRHVLLYTEMVVTGALLRGDPSRALAHDPAEHPLALQLGGSDPEALSRCARMAEDCAFDEVNLNLGCPSERVQEHRFGACLMAEPERVARCIAAMRGATRLPVTVKTRLGIDDRDSYPELCQFIDAVSSAGCRTVILHARKAWLNGLSPKENRERPPLRYQWVHQLKRDFPALEVILNGGITGLDEIERQLAYVDGVMIGREAYRNPYLLAEMDRRFFGATSPAPTRDQVLSCYREYMARERAVGTPVHHMTRHLAGLFLGQPGARLWRQRLLLPDGADRDPCAA